MAAKHEQSETHHENDDRRDAAIRGHQVPTTKRNVRLLIASINVTSAVSSTGVVKENVCNDGGLNITGRMAELDYLFSGADLDIIGAQESRLPQTQILQTNGYTVFNSGAMPGKHHYGVQLWVRKHHAKAVKCTEAVSPRLLVAKFAMRAVPSDTVARTLHVLVLHAPCEVAAPHESDAFYIQVHERLNAVPRGQLCLILGDFNARVGSIAADCFGGYAPVTENQKGERMRELLTESDMVALNTFFPGDPYTWTKVTGRPARLDYICASAELLPCTTWAGVRRDIDVRAGSAEDHWPVVAEVHLSIGDSAKAVKKCPVSVDRSLARVSWRILDFRERVKHMSLRDDLDVGSLCTALTTDVATAARACFAKGKDEPRKDWISGDSWQLIKWPQSLRTDLRVSRASISGMRVAVAFNAWKWTVVDGSIG